MQFNNHFQSYYRRRFNGDLAQIHCDLLNFTILCSDRSRRLDLFMKPSLATTESAGLQFQIFCPPLDSKFDYSYVSINTTNY